MVLDPKDLSKLTDEERRSIVEMEQQIDARLAESAQSMKKGISYTIPNGASLRAVQIIIEKYRDAGWIVKREGDQREGYSLLEIKTPENQ